MVKYENLIIRRSKTHKDLVLSSNVEKVFRVFYKGQEKLNTLNYDEASDYFNDFEKVLNNGGDLE